jgi:hypothetical protein
MIDRLYQKRSIPKESACDHCYWKYISKGEDDAEKECFCDLDDEYCFGKRACKARMKGADDEAN